MSLNVLTQGGGAGGASASIFVTGLSEADTVTAVKEGKTVNGKWVTKANPKYVGLPDGYTQLEYIQSTGTQYIDTGVVGKSGVETNAEIMWLGTIDDQSAIGARNSNSVRIYPIDIGDGYWNLGYNENIFSSVKPSAGVKYTVYSKLAAGSQVLIVDGTTLINNTNTASYNTGINMWLPASNGNGSILQPGQVRIYNMSISMDGAQVREYIPAKRNSDNVIGLYDLVNDEFYTNAGTGTFIAGAEIPPTFDCHTITIKDYGMWTVTATNGEKTTTQDVLVDAAMDYEIEVDYKLWLYREGEEFEEVTGGWISTQPQTYPMGTATKNENSLYLSAQRQSAGWTFQNEVDVTEFTTLKAVITAQNLYNRINLYTGTAYADPSIAQKENLSGDNIEVSIDIANISGNYKVHLGCWVTGSSYETVDAATMTIYKVWLE